jgi:hypothetical protein
LKAHKDHTKYFKDLTYAEQAKSINAIMANLSKTVRAHMRKAKDKNKAKQKCLNQVKRLLKRIEKL